MLNQLIEVGGLNTQHKERANDGNESFHGNPFRDLSGKLTVELSWFLKINLFCFHNINDLYQLKKTDLCHILRIFVYNKAMRDEKLNKSPFSTEVTAKAEAQENILESYPIVVFAMFLFFYFLNRDIIHPFISNLIP